MKLLVKYGLNSPRVDIVSFSDGTRKIALFAENRFQSPRYAKRFSYFEELFDNFLITEIQNNMYTEVVSILKEENNGQDLDEKVNIKDEIVSYIESKFEKYLDENSVSIESSINNIINTSFPKLTFKKTKNLFFIQTTTDEEDVGIVFFLVMNNEIAKKRGIDNFIYNDSEIQSIIENICYRNKIKNSSVTVYYYIATEREIVNSNFTPILKKSLLNGLMKVTLIPINDYQKNNTKRTISLHLLSEKDIEKNNKQITRGDF